MTDQPSVAFFRTGAGPDGPAGEPLAVLPSGRMLDLRRRRSEGPLDREELDWCHARGVALAYDPAQVGWVPAGGADDLRPADRPGPGRVRFRRWGSEDLGRYVALLDDRRVWAHLPESYPDPLTPALARELIVLSNEADHHEVLAIEAGGEAVGQVRLAFEPGSADRREGEVSYWLGAAHWGQGIASEAVAQFTARSFRLRPALEAIVARVHEGNPASARVLEKAGYRDAGRHPGDRSWRLFRRTRPGR